MSSWPGCWVVAVRWICLVGAARFVGVVSRCGSYGLSARSSMRFMRSSSSTASTWAPNAVVLIAQTPDCVLGWYATRSENSRAWSALIEPDRAPSPGRHRQGQRLREGVQEHLADHARSTLHLPRVLPYPPSHHNAPQTGSLAQLVCSGAPSPACTTLKAPRNGEAPTRPGARAGRASWRRKHRRPEGDGNTPTNVSFGLVTASTSSSPRGSCSPTWTPPGPTRCPR